MNALESLAHNPKCDLWFFARAPIISPRLALETECNVFHYKVRTKNVTMRTRLNHICGLKNNDKWHGVVFRPCAYNLRENATVYFNNNSSRRKNEMRGELKKIMPKYIKFWRLSTSFFVTKYILLQLHSFPSNCKNPWKKYLSIIRRYQIQMGIKDLRKIKYTDVNFEGPTTNICVFNSNAF